MLNVQCDVNISLARELPPLTLRCMTHGAVRNDPVHDEVSVLVPQIDPSVPQPVFTITEKAPTRAFSWLKEPTSAFTFKTLLRNYDKWALTPWSLNVKLGPRLNYCKGQAVW